MEKKEKILPEKKIRVGNVTATIWSNKRKVGKDEFESKSIVIERNYKNQQDEWNATNSFGINDLAKVELVVREAYAYLMLNKEEQN